MSMGYIVYREDLDNESEIQYTVDNNPDMYPMGTVIQTKDGDAWIVVFNDGVTVTLQLINNGGTSNLWANDVDNPNGGIVNTDQDNNNSVRVVGNLGVGAIPAPYSTFLGNNITIGGSIFSSLRLETQSDTTPFHTATVVSTEESMVIRKEEKGDISFETSDQERPRVTILEQGNVGFHTIVPDSILHVVADDNIVAESNIGIKLDRFGDTTNPSQIELRKARGDYEEALITPVLSGDQLGEVGAYGQTTAEVVYNTGMSDLAAYILFHAAENFSPTNTGTEMTFGTTPLGATVPVERMKIHADGGITIGSPTGGSQGAGTLNVENGVFVNGTPV